MAQFELHADYDRDGRLTATAAEHALRTTAPGAILVPNLDIDARPLPDKAERGPRRTVDAKQPVLRAGDDEALPLIVRVKGPVEPLTRVFLRPVGFPKIRVSVYDARGRILPRDLARGDDLPLAVPVAGGDLHLSLTTNAFPGAPYGRVTSLDTKYAPGTEDEATLLLQLVVVDPGGNETEADSGLFTIAPFIVLAHDAPPLRAYVAESGGNDATLKELQPALAALGVPLKIVPPQPAPPGAAPGVPPVSDTWIQDQFQPAVVQGADGWRHVVLHLPRTRADSLAASVEENLGSFVVSHFPARNVLLVDDLWFRDLHVFDVDGRQHVLSFRECLAVAAEMDAATRLLKRLYDALNPLQDAVTDEVTRNWSDSLTGVLTALARLDAHLRALPPLPRTASAEQRDARERTVKYFHDAYGRVLARYRYAGPQSPFVQVATARESFRMRPADADRLQARLLQMRASPNYGGNIEATPPMENAPLGKLIVGNVLLTQGERTWDTMDPDLLHLLAQQRKQPMVALDSAWLHVGHVDEMLSVVPDGGGFALLRASPALALELLKNANERYRAGLSPADRKSLLDEPSGVLERLMVKGSSPMTRLLRGKTWRHTDPPADAGAVPNVVEPPGIYQKLSRTLNGTGFERPLGGGVNIHGIRYWPGHGPERAYPADITIAELLYCEQDDRRRSTNGTLATGRNANVDKVLDAQFPRIRRLPLPVVFDRMADAGNFGLTTGAYTPNVVNMLVIGTTLLVPRPYGPRMQLADAAEVIATSLRALNLPAELARRVDAGFVRRHGLGKAVYWLERHAPIERIVDDLGGPPTVGDFKVPVYEGLETEAHVIAQFADSFPGADDATLRSRIIDPNTAQFDAVGKLKDGARRFEIDDGLVDLFEASILAVTDELGLTVNWIDSWFYHLRLGEIHCGTNLLRAPPRGRSVPPVWDVKQTLQGPHGVEGLEFEGVEIKAKPEQP